MYPHLFRCSTIKCFTNFFQLSLKDLSVALLFITFNTLFSFQGAMFRSLLKPDVNVQSLERFHLFSKASRLLLSGGDSRDRTGDLLLARQALSQLSYIPSSSLIRKVVGPSGLEPPTLRLSVVRSSQLSYGPIQHSRACAL